MLGTLKVTNVRLPEKILSETDELAEKHGLNRSEVVRQALTVYLHLVENFGTMLRPIAFQVNPSQIMYLRRGDLVVLKLPTGHSIVVGSTSSGAVGPNSLDKIKVDGWVLGKYLARVALMDVAAVGAFPLLLSVTLGVKKEPFGREILEGTRHEALILGLEPNQVLLEKTEENFDVVQTGAGLTVVGLANEADLRLARTLPGDLLVAVGKPKVGDEVLPAEVRGEVADLKSMILLSHRKFVHDIFPVGPFGIANEARTMAFAVGRQIKFIEDTEIDLEKSAGPATVMLVTIDCESFEELKSLIGKPITIIGEIL